MKRISIALLAGLMLVATGAQAAGKTGWYVGGGLGWNKYETKQDVDLLSGTDTNQRCLSGDISGYPNSPAACHDFYETNGSTFNETAFGLDAFVGWEFIPNWSVELQYVWLGTTDKADSVSVGGAPFGGVTAGFPPAYDSNDELSYKQEIKAISYNILGRYHWAMSPKWGLNFVAGWGVGKAEYGQSVQNIQIQAADASWFRPEETARVNKRDNGYILGFGTTINTSEHVFLRIEYNYYGYDFDNTIKAPGRVAFDVGYQF